jgi:hypothetical protein
VIENLSMLRGKNIEFANGMIMYQPTLGDIEQLTESKYMNMLGVFIASPFDMIAQLDEIGIDFTKITSYQLFCITYRTLEKSQTKILFGDFDFAKLRKVDNDGKVELRNETTVINEDLFNEIVQAIRTINCLSPPKFKGVANEYTKMKMIEYAKSELELYKRRKSKPKSVFKTLISRAVNHPYFKYKLEEIWDMKVYVFYDFLKSINVIENSNYLNMGAYSGNIDISKINKSELNWLREFEE